MDQLKARAFLAEFPFLSKIKAFSTVVEKNCFDDFEIIIKPVDVEYLLHIPCCHHWDGSMVNVNQGEEIASILKETSRETNQILKEMARANREQNCLLSVPLERRAAMAETCKRIAQ